MYLSDFLPASPRLRFVPAVLVLVLMIPGHSKANTLIRRVVHASPATTIAFGQQSGNIRPFRVTITASGVIRLSGPIQVTGKASRISTEAVAGLVLLARTDGFRSLPSFTACSGVLPDIATRYITIHTASWRHRASVRGNCRENMTQLFAVLLNVTHVSFQ